MKKLYNLAVKTGSYEKDGETKSRYENIGSIMEGENGKFIFLKRTFNPAGIAGTADKSDIIVSMFPPKNKSDSPSDTTMSDDDVPFY